MPGFTAHWLVAIRSIESAPAYVKSGFDAYALAVNSLNGDLTTAIDNIIKGKATVKAFMGEAGWIHKTPGRFDQIIEECDKAFKGIGKDEEGKDKPNPALRDDITCFSAYMLGACGPDFWMMPSHGGGRAPLNMGAHHFDLGHYNRTHMVFKRFVYELITNPGKFPYSTGNGKKEPLLQAKVAISYYMGMCTHFAADLVVHPLVNVSAGAYGLLTKEWQPEMTGGLNIFNTHNKVEHYWDSYLKWRIFCGDVVIGDKAADATDQKLWADANFTSLHFPTAESLVRYIGTPDTKDKKELIAFIEKSDNKYLLEKCHNFAHVFCDRMLEEKPDIQTFLYDIAVDKKHGAYPRKLMYAKACQEAIDTQFDDAVSAKRETGKREWNKREKAWTPEITKTGKSEKLKLNAFSSSTNKGKSYNSLNWINYVALPDLEKVAQYGMSVFYDRSALPRFLDRAANTAGELIKALNRAILLATHNTSAIKSMHDVNLGVLEGFWNLDTGMGLRVLKDEDSRTTREVNTILDFQHILNEATHLAIGHSIDYAYMAKINSAEYGRNPSGDGINVFKIYGGDECRFEDILKVKEKEQSHLDKIRVDHPVQSQNTLSAATTQQNNQQPTNIVKQPMWNRLNLTLRGYMPDFQNRQETMAFYFYGDKAKTFHSEKGTLGEYSLDDKFIRKWLTTSAKPFDFFTTGTAGKSDNKRDGVEIFKRGAYDLCQFDTHFLATVETKDDAMEKILSGENWCNVVSDTLRSLYGWNFAVGTGRKKVLHPAGSGTFCADRDFESYKNVSPTEYVYFSVHPLIKMKEYGKGAMPKGWSFQSTYLDIISEKMVAKEQIEKDLIKINWMGFVKIVLIYEYVKERDRGVQLKEYYIDGCKFNANGYAVG